MKNENFEKKLSQRLIFAQSFTPFNFMDTMHQLAVKINYTNGDLDMLTTPMPEQYGNDKGDFTNEEEYFQFIDWLIANSIPKAASDL